MKKAYIICFFLLVSVSVAGYYFQIILPSMDLYALWEGDNRKSVYITNPENDAENLVVIEVDQAQWDAGYENLDPAWLDAAISNIVSQAGDTDNWRREDKAMVLYLLEQINVVRTNAGLPKISKQDAKKGIQDYMH